MSSASSESVPSSDNNNNNNNSNKVPRQSRNRRNNRRPKSNKGDEITDKNDETTSVKRSSKRNNKNRKGGSTRKRNESVNTNGSVKEYAKPEYKENSALVKQRQEQIDQCLYALGKDNFKLFRNGKYVTTYAVNFRNNSMSSIFPKEMGIKFAINIPHDYPQQSLKLSSNKSNSQETSDNEALNNLVRNFNSSVRNNDNNSCPILAQLNYLVQEVDILKNPTFKKIENSRSAFYAQFSPTE
ncbi:similar to Saccharomyces cerevisiae YIL161W Putative protein of unknown function [Maudiozyma saulgeensis]|uniref:RWD domain-containing protein n=1 Tax=Maudiozyma saulgeensis TaxID=1789683 RepID=A0A1X7QWU6_9SACH|nr:similar to Saccharomyces cerevisiae YIL161W Putative protein of unknown function [Kazachstania saulgeensis]